MCQGPRPWHTQFVNQSEGTKARGLGRHCEFVGQSEGAKARGLGRHCEFVGQREGAKARGLGRQTQQETTSLHEYVDLSF